ncbi:DUF4176 domain-containing protein [Streptococcus plurextorum]|uniref:DUF4176 domain-containing protein n=1 Tax=Streptococcus plurextorum TaxID=456876 RepID=UPI00040979A2|nr:DUF4176 domain-containing protein [Streptococcus plurextorum]
MQDRILPIGSVITIKGGNIPLLIVSRAALFEYNGELGYFDYSAVLYPEGITDGKEFIFFNREDIESVIYFGYVNSEEQIFAENYDRLVSESTYPKLQSDKFDI